jgi:hypothetical protein
MVDEGLPRGQRRERGGGRDDMRHHARPDGHAGSRQADVLRRGAVPIERNQLVHLVTDRQFGDVAECDHDPGELVGRDDRRAIDPADDPRLGPTSSGPP